MKWVAIVWMSIVVGMLAAADAQPPVIHYDQRYYFVQVDRGTIAILDSAAGQVWLATVAKYGFDTWRTYDLNVIAAEKRLGAVVLPKAFGEAAIRCGHSANL
jgi:hypothetical protein